MWLRTTSAALTRVHGTVVRSTMTFNKVVAAAVEPCYKREIDCPYRVLNTYGRFMHVVPKAPVGSISEIESNN